MRNITVTRQKDSLNQEEWRFHFYDNRLALVLTNYTRRERQSPRHKFRTVEYWDTYKDGRNTYSSGIELKDIILPDDVKDEALQSLISSLRVVKSFEEARGEVTQ